MPSTGDTTSKPTDTRATTPAAAVADSPPTAGHVNPPPRGWRDAWQLPLSILGIALLVLGLLTIARRTPGPDVEGVLADAAALIDRQRPAEALDLLNGPIVKVLDPSDPGSTGTIARYHALRAEALFLAHQERQPDHSSPAGKANNTRILEEFARARKLDPAQINPRRSAFIAETLVHLERFDEALAAADALPANEGERARRLLKRIIDGTIAGPPGRSKLGRDALARLRARTDLTDDDRAWALSRWARMELSDARPGAVIDALLPEIHRLDTPGISASTAAGDYHLLLGQAYLAIGDMEQSRTFFTLAEALIPSGDKRRGEVEIGLAHIAHSKGDLEEARDRYASVAERFPGLPTQAEAFLGLGATEGDLGRFDESLHAYASLVDLLRSRKPAGRVAPDHAETSIEQRHRARAAAGDHARAIAYAELAVRAYPDGEAPARALLRLAESHRVRAADLLGEEHSGGEHTLRHVSPTDAEEARLHYERAGRAYEQHARAAIVDAPTEASDSLWNAADCFDRAGNQEQAIRLFSEYAHSRRHDPRHLEAQFRLGRCFQAMNEPKTAISMYEEILARNPASDEASRSHVPLAQCYLMLGGEAEASKAETLLLGVLDGQWFKPEAPQFRQALLELAQYYLRAARYPEAITRLTEAIQRYPDAPERTRLRFDLADAMRLSAGVIDRQLRDAMPLSERMELESLRAERLRNALGLYEEVRSTLDSRDPASLTPLESIIHRNAILYRGDCAFDLGDYDLAIRHYAAAAQRFADDPASLVPLVQIVNCYAALGRWPEARTAHERARMRLKEIPDAVWNAATLPMNRRHWERWLESSLQLEELEARAAASTESP